MGTISVSNDFKSFCNELRMSEDTVSNIQTRYHAITKRINQDFWNTDSDVRHSLYVGSYGRGTCIYTSDIDIIVELPWSEYSKYNEYSGNGQSYLLQVVKLSLRSTYSRSDLSADGQVIDIWFADGGKFEVVPAFKFSEGSGYYYPDTNNGGSWKSMNPKLEIDSFNLLNKKTNNNLKRLCRMVRAWNSTNNVLMPGILIDTIAFRFLSNYEYADKSYSFYDWMSRDFFKYLYDNADQEYWLKPGTKERVYKKYTFENDAKKAYELCLEALEDYSNDYTYSWHEKWRKIYGNKFPSK